MIEFLKKILPDYATNDVNEISEETTIEELGIDSLTLAEMVWRLEDSLGDTQLEFTKKPVNLGDIIAIIKPYQDQLENAG